MCNRIQYLPQSPAFWGVILLVLHGWCVCTCWYGLLLQGLLLTALAQHNCAGAVEICAVSAPHHRPLQVLRLLAVVPLTAAASLRHQSHRRQLSCADIPAVPANLCRSGIRPLPGSVVLIVAAAIELFARSPTLRTQSSGALSTDQFGSETPAYYRN